MYSPELKAHKNRLLAKRLDRIAENLSNDSDIGDTSAAMHCRIAAAVLRAAALAHENPVDTKYAKKFFDEQPF